MDNELFAIIKMSLFELMCSAEREKRELFIKCYFYGNY